MDKSKTILNVVRKRLGNQPYYNPVEFLEMCATVRDELEAAEQLHEADVATCLECGANESSGHYLICSQSEK